jgi:hypothetical protein
MSAQREQAGAGEGSGPGGSRLRVRTVEMREGEVRYLD